MKAYQIMEEILEELSVFEDLRSTITNKYGPMFGDKFTPEGGRLHGKAIEANVNEIVSAAKRNLPDEEKNSMTAIEKEMGKIGARRNNTKNKIGEYRTRVRNSQYRNFPVDWNPPKTDAEKAEGSIKRKFKKDKSFPVFQALRSLKSKQDSSEALEIMEAIINEFTEVDKKEAAKKVLPERKKEYLSKYAQVLDAADEVGSENVPDGNLKDLERAEKRYKHAEKVANEALSLAESIIGYADNIFELDYENKQNVNTNKIRKLKKDKDGENVEVVSVADELFPYEGNAKQQFNQKVLAKINDMIEGQGSLEDLIQFVRKYSGNRKVANESTEISEAVKLLEEMINKTVEKYTDDDGNVHELEFGNSSNKDNVNTKYQFRHKINGKPVVSASDSEPNANYERKHAIKNYNLKKANKSIEEIKQVAEGLFVKDGRGDLLNDIDNALGSPVKKTVKDIVKQCTGCKQKKVNEAVELMEEIINELNDSTVDSAYVKRMDNYDNAVKDYKEATARHDKDIEKIRAKYSDEDIVNGKADAELDKAAEKVEPYQKALYVADKKFDNMYKLYKNREQRKQGK